jgi:hypothetical protein
VNSLLHVPAPLFVSTHSMMGRNSSLSSKISKKPRQTRINWEGPHADTIMKFFVKDYKRYKANKAAAAIHWAKKLDKIDVYKHLRITDTQIKNFRQGNVIFLGGLWDLCPGKPEPQDGPINPPFSQISKERPAPPSASQSPISNRQHWSNLVALNRSGGILASNCH